MIPVKTLLPITKKAYVTYGLIVANLLVFLWELTMPRLQLSQAFYELAFVACTPGQSLVSIDTGLDIFRSMFFHGDWFHIIGNMTYLWLFGRHIEEYLGGMRFLGLYLLAGYAAAFAEALINVNVCGVPMIGASGAISGVLGMFIVLYPGVRVRVMILLFRILPRYFNLPALLLLGFWFVMQLISGFASLETNASHIAFFAHVGGFVFGFVAIFIYTLFNKSPEIETYSD